MQFISSNGCIYEWFIQKPLKISIFILDESQSALLFEHMLLMSIEMGVGNRRRDKMLVQQVH